jgi:hypothetical protein
VEEKVNVLEEEGRVRGKFLGAKLEDVASYFVILIYIKLQ